MRRLLRKDVTPPDGFRYVTPETGYVVTAVDWWTWISQIKAHRAANNLPIPADLVDVAEDRLCACIPPEWCERSERPQWTSIRFGIEDVKNGMKAFAKLMLGGFKFVDQAEAERRAYLCAGCSYNVQAEGCGTCAKIAQLVTGDVAKRTTAYDGQLKSCAVCHCVCSVAVHFPNDALESSDTPVHQAAYPSWCWRKKDGENYLANDSGVAQMVERRTHNPKAGDSSSPPATYLT